MSLKKWVKVSDLASLFGVLAFLLGAVLIMWVAIKYNGQRIPTVGMISGAFGLSSLLCAAACYVVHDEYCGRVGKFRANLGTDDLRQYVELSSSQMEDLCLRRLKELGYVWEEANRNNPMPFAKERREAEKVFRRAYWFFEKYKFIKPTKWNRFFPKPETQK